MSAWLVVSRRSGSTPATVLALGTLVLLAACDAPLRPLPSTMCHEVRSSSGGEDAASEPTDAEWIALLTDDEEGGPSSCERVLALAPPPEPSCDGEPPAPAGERFAIPPRLVVRTHREGEDDVVWVATHRTGDGFVGGPIALVRRTALGLEVQALGRHVGPAEHAEARVLRAGGLTVVAIESDHDGDRVADLLVRAGGALVPAALEEPELGCRAPARISLRARRDARAEGGWMLRTVHTAVLAEDESAIVVREHLSVREIDPREPDAPPRATHETDAVRRLVARGARLRADRAPLSASRLPRRRAEPAGPGRFPTGAPDATPRRSAR